VVKLGSIIAIGQVKMRIRLTWVEFLRMMAHNELEKTTINA
jgi:hypothetical protein